MLIFEFEGESFVVGGLKLAIFHAAFVEHANGSFHFFGVVVVVVAVGIDDFFDAGLDDGFGALVAREVVDVEFGALKFAHVAAEVEDGIELAVADVGVLSIEFVALAAPREIVVREAVGSAVVADGKDAVIGADDTGADLGVGVFATKRGKFHNSDKIFVPTQIICSFIAHRPPFRLHYNTIR